MGVLKIELSDGAIFTVDTTFVVKDNMYALEIDHDVDGTYHWDPYMEKHHIDREFPY